MIKAICLCFILVYLSSCKKDKLDGDKEIFVGSWKWHKTKKAYSLCNPPSFETELTPISENKIFRIKFFQKGKVEFYENENLIEKYRVVFSSYGVPCNPSTYTFYEINLNNEVQTKIVGCISLDTLVVLKDFPFPDPENACENYTNYFVKE